MYVGVCWFTFPGVFTYSLDTVQSLDMFRSDSITSGPLRLNPDGLQTSTSLRFAVSKPMLCSKDQRDGSRPHCLSVMRFISQLIGAKI